MSTLMVLSQHPRQQFMHRDTKGAGHKRSGCSTTGAHTAAIVPPPKAEEALVTATASERLDKSLHEIGRR